VSLNPFDYITHLDEQRNKNKLIAQTHIE